MIVVQTGVNITFFIIQKAILKLLHLLTLTAEIITYYLS